MIVTIHQPNFAPWTGYFDKMVRSDVFVLLDVVPFTKGGYQNRVKVKGPAGPQWLTVPVQTKGRLGQLTRDVETNELLPWRENHIKTMRTLYGRSPGHDTASTMLSQVYANPTTTLADLCTDLITRLRDHYAIPTRLVRASELEATGSSSQLLADIVAELGGDTYLSGPSGRNYLDEQLFRDRGIEVDHHSFTPTPYPQPHGDFVGGLSMLDHLASGADPWW
ncbi:MAG: WbqC family protein [Arachnia propionica]|uniref:WbqC family protein n=1 Tax=Arachnia propionica TaxID=1750 RepID=UPI00270145AC|nr:WbqC family protein [Arachnia propionica]